jgi:hypothetical protein
MAQNGQSTRSKGDLRRARLADSDSPVAQQHQAKDRKPGRIETRTIALPRGELEPGACA